MLTQMFHLHALSALHVGVGQAIGTVDLPIARSKATNLPLVPGSAIKGVLRDEFDAQDERISKTLFGPASINENADAHAGALALGDAHLLLLPVRSLAGVMALATCPFVLSRYAADLQRTGVVALPAVPSIAPGHAAWTEISALVAAERKIILDDLDLSEAKADAQPWADRLAKALYPGDAAWQEQFIQHFAVLSDDDFSFLADTATEVRARIRIDDATGVVKQGALWYEENLPAESVLWGVIGFGRSRVRHAAQSAADIQQSFNTGLPSDPLLQIGGKATVGRGLVRFVSQADVA